MRSTSANKNDQKSTTSNATANDNNEKLAGVSSHLKINISEKKLNKKTKPAEEKDIIGRQHLIYKRKFWQKETWNFTIGKGNKNWIYNRQSWTASL